MHAVPASVIDPVWDRFQALVLLWSILTLRRASSSRRRTGRVRQARPGPSLGAYVKIAAGSCSATTIRRRRDEWIDAEVFSKLEQFCLDGYQKMIGLDVENLVVDGCIVESTLRRRGRRPLPVDRGKQGTRRSLLVEGGGIPLGVVVAPATRNDFAVTRPDAGEPSAGSASSCLRRSPCTWTPVGTPARPVNFSPVSAATS